MRGRVVVGVSGSLASLAAVRRGIVEARRTDGALVAVMAWEPPEGEAAFRRRPEASWARLWADEARQRLDRALDEAVGGVPADLRVDRLVIRGTPGAVLCAVASGAEDLLLIGAARPARHMARVHRRSVHRRSVHRRSVHRAVLANADCAVLIVAGPRLLRREARLLRRATRNEGVRLLAPRPQRGRP